MGTPLFIPIAQESSVSEQFDRLAVLLGDQAPERVDALFDEVLMPRKKATPATLSEVIEHTIRERGLSAYAVAKSAGINAAMVQRFLNHERGLTLRTVERLAAALDLVLVPREQTGKGDSR
jgi:DNA-binding phage protein